MLTKGLLSHQLQYLLGKLGVFNLFQTPRLRGYVIEIKSQRIVKDTNEVKAGKASQGSASSAEEERI